MKQKPTQLEDKQRHSWRFLAVKTSPSDVGGVSLIPGQGTKILHITWPRHQTIKQKPCCNKFKEDLKIVHIKKKKKKEKNLKKEKRKEAKDLNRHFSKEET